GRLLSKAGIFDEAAEAFDRAVGVARAQEDPAAMVWAMREAAQVAVLRRRFAQANGLLEQGRQFSPTDELTLLLRLDEARIDALCNRWASAIAHLEESLNLARTKLSPSHPFVDHTMISLAAARMELHGADATSRTLLDRALGIRLARNKAADSPEIAEALLLLGEHHRLNGNIDDALPLIGRANLRYRFDQSANLVRDVESARFAALADPAAQALNEDRHLLSPVERFGLGIQRTDSLDIGVGFEAPVRAGPVAVHPLLEWRLRVPVNRQGFRCLVVPARDGEDGCLAQEGGKAFPQSLTLGARVLPPLRGLSVLVGLDIGLTGVRSVVRELAPTPPYRVLLAVAYALPSTRAGPAGGR
ncbi:MAG: hypothetical protein AAFV29_23515, partial [Myxococcota bacterium]